MIAKYIFLILIILAVALEVARIYFLIRKYEVNSKEKGANDFAPLIYFKNYP